jgi:hypothetical protein
MNRLLTSSLILVTACTTVQTGRELKSTEVDPPKCAEPELVVTATPADYPNVLLEVTEERSCISTSHDTWLVHSEMHGSPMILGIAGALIGAAAGVGGLFALQSQYSQSESLAYRGDASIILPFVGALAGFGASQLVRNPNLTETLTPVEETESHDEQHVRHGSPANGTLAFREGTREVISVLRDGQAYVPVGEAERTFSEGLTLNGRPIEWSMRNSAKWRPELLPQCERAAEVASRKMEHATLEELAAATKDAIACGDAGWPFADQLTHKLDRICARRFQAPCDGVITK